MTSKCSPEAFDRPASEMSDLTAGSWLSKRRFSVPSVLARELGLAPEQLLAQSVPPQYVASASPKGKLSVLPGLRQVGAPSLLFLFQLSKEAGLRPLAERDVGLRSAFSLPRL